MRKEPFMNENQKHIFKRIVIITVVIAAFALFFYFKIMCRIEIEDDVPLDFVYYEAIIEEDSAGIGTEQVIYEPDDADYEQVVDLIENHTMFWSIRTLWASWLGYGGGYMKSIRLHAGNDTIHICRNGDIYYNGNVYRMGIHSEEKAAQWIEELESLKNEKH